MNPESQVITLQQAKRLKELGVKQSSFLFWRETLNGFAISLGDSDIDFITGFIEPDTIIMDEEEQIFSAFTCAELGEMLPEYVYSKLNSGGGDKWCCLMVEGHVRMPDIKLKDFYAATESAARGAMLIHLIENKLITVEQINSKA